ncbi:hypothetical protein ACHAXR_006332 [Thalassiosira sp. AJA248-18]
MRHSRSNPPSHRPFKGVPSNINVVADNSTLRSTDPNAPPHTTSLSPESLSLARLRQKSISHPMQQCQLTIYVPPHTVGAVIGRGGRTILNVQREAMRRSAGHVAPVRISVLGGSGGNNNGSSGSANGHVNQQQHEGANSSSDNKQGGEQSFSSASQQGGGQTSNTWNYHEYYNSLNQQQQQQPQQQQHQPNNDNATDSTNDDDWTPVIIRGDPVGCFSAVRQILPLVDRDHDPNIVLDVPIHRAKHNMLVGKGGIIIAALSATYETRIMIPPNEFMANVGGGENFWSKRQVVHMGSDVGSAMLFGEGGGGGGGAAAAGGSAMMNHNANSNNNPATPGALPPNIIQLEGDIDKIEQCLVKMLSIVSGERWIPTGVIVEKVEVNNSGNKSASANNSAAAAAASPNAAPGKGLGKDETTAEAVIVKIWTPSSKLLNLGKIRKVQRKTSTVIRRKKIRFNGNYIDASGRVVANAKEEEVEEDTAEPSLVNEDIDEEEGVPKEVSVAGGPKTATKYIITGKTESVRSAAAQFEKILGLEPGTSTTITDTTNKTKFLNDSTTNKDANVQTGPNKPESESENGGGGGPSGVKKVRRKKKRGKGGNAPKGSKEGPSQNLVGDT